MPQEPLAQATPLHIVLATAIKVAQLDTTDVDLETLINTHVRLAFVLCSDGVAVNILAFL